MKEQGFRMKVICSLIMVSFYAIRILVFILWLMVEVISMFLYTPELCIAFIVALCRDRWQMWFNPWLEKRISGRLWDTILGLGNKAREYAP